MDPVRRCYYISNSYYNKGLRLINNNDVSGCTEALKKSLQFDKTNTNARNLLGLVYYHIGEVSDALVQWVISLNIQPSNNPANRYVDQLQRQSGLVDSMGTAISKFNQCLSMVKGGSEDLALMQLQKLTVQYRNYLRPWLLLGILYMKAGEDGKAYRAFQNAVRLDTGNRLANQCLYEIRKKKALDSKGKMGSIRDVLSSGKKKASEDGDSIVPEPYRENTGLGTAANMLIGFIIGIAAVLFIYFPSVKKNMNTEYNKRVIEISNSLNDANTRIKELEADAESLNSRIDELDLAGESFDEDMKKKLAAYQKIYACSNYLQKDDMKSAAQVYVTIDPESIASVEDPDGLDISLSARYKEISDMMNENGYMVLQKAGDAAYESKDYTSALEYFTLSYGVHPTNPAPLYKMGKCHVMMGDKETANEIFTQVIEKFPDSNVAELAKTDRGY